MNFKYFTSYLKTLDLFISSLKIYFIFKIIIYKIFPSNNHSQIFIDLSLYINEHLYYIIIYIYNLVAYIKLRSYLFTK